ncbi:MAG: protein tyrosine phosphatase [Myxococcales bacterium]|nr:protein tyrosine phosphatase [Myxococcales bacterium]
MHSAADSDPELQAILARPGYVDLHSHYIPAVDDGVHTRQEGVELCRGLSGIGFGAIVATPHMRTAMFDNERIELQAHFARFQAACGRDEGMPALGLAAEHFCDDVFWARFERGQVLPYPGERAALIELPVDAIPLGLEERVFRMNLKGVRPVLAHPERYAPLYSRTGAIERLLQQGVLPLLDVMSLEGKYGRRPRKAAERMLAEGVYYAACSDAHKPSDVARVAEGIARLRKRVGEAEAEAMLDERPRRILRGEVDR